MTTLLWAAYCIFLACLFFSIGCNIAASLHEKGRAQGREESKPIRLTNGQLIGRSLK